MGSGSLFLAMLVARLWLLVGQSVESSLQSSWHTGLCTYSHGPQRIHLTDLGDPQTFHPAPRTIYSCSTKQTEISIYQSLGMSLKFCQGNSLLEIMFIILLWGWIACHCPKIKGHHKGFRLVLQCWVFISSLIVTTQFLQKNLGDSLQSVWMKHLETDLWGYQQFDICGFKWHFSTIQ